ncbi:response regulator transcription factor [Vallitalea sediminicola]
MNIKVMVVEDKKALNQTLVKMLKKEKYEAVGVMDFQEAKSVYMSISPHIVLLDVMLPNGSGYDLIPYLRAYNNCRIIMISALNDSKSKTQAYENGADDYISKPFDLYELIYKLNALKKRILSELKEYEIGDISFNTETHYLSCKGKSFVIQPSQIKLLKVLVEKKEEDSYLKRNEFGSFFSEEVNENVRMQTLIARLRKNITAIGSEEIIIETFYGKGYQLVVCQQRENK